MKKQNNSKTPYPETWDSGTYQTGVTNPPKNSPLVPVLLVAVIFLGGLASALGLINIRLLLALQQAPEETIPVQIQGSQNNNSDNTADETAPSVPEGTISMEICGGDTDFLPKDSLESEEILSHSAASTVAVSTDGEISVPGLVLKENGYILTYAHMVCDAQRIYVTLPDGTQHRASVVGCDMLTDLAVIYIKTNGLTCASFADPKQGDSPKVMALSDGELTGGALCAVKPAEIGGKKLAVLQTSAATAQDLGSLWNYKGQVVGILSPYMARYLQAQAGDLAYVIPSDLLQQIVHQLVSRGYVAGRPSLGVSTEEINELYQNYWQLPNGLRITSSFNDALQASDILISIDGTPISTRSDLYAILVSRQMGQNVEAQVYRGGQHITVTLTIGEENCKE